MASVEYVDSQTPSSHHSHQQEVTVHSPPSGVQSSLHPLAAASGQHRPSIAGSAHAAVAGSSTLAITEKEESLSPAVPSIVHLPFVRQSPPVPGLRYRNLGKSGLRISNVGLGMFHLVLLLIKQKALQDSTIQRMLRTLMTSHVCWCTKSSHWNPPFPFEALSLVYF